MDDAAPAPGCAARMAVPLAASLGGQAVVALAALTPPVLAVAAAPEFGIRASDVGFFTTLLFLLAMLSATTGGALVARLGAIRVSQLCLLACTAGLLLVASARLSLAALGALLIGLGYGPMTPASSHLLAPVTTVRNRPLVFSVKQTSIPLGGALAGLLAPALAAAAGWRWAVVVVAAVAAATGGLLQLIRATCDARRDPSVPLALHIAGPLREALARPRLRELCLVSLGYSAVQICFSAFFVTFLVESAGLSLVDAGVALTVAQAAGVAGRVVWGTVAERAATTRRLLAVLGVLMAMCAALTALAGAGWSLPAFLVLGAVFGATAVGWNGLYLAEIVRVTSQAESARATGAALFFTFGGMMVGPAVFSAAVALTDSYALAFVLLAASAAPAAALLFRAER